MNYVLGFVFLIFLMILVVLLPFVANTKKARMTRYFRYDHTVRFPLVNRISSHPSLLPEDLTHQEMVAVLAMICAKQTVSQSLSLAQCFADWGWHKKYDDEFFDRLYGTAKKFRARRWRLESDDLMQIGRALADVTENAVWNERFSGTVK